MLCFVPVLHGRVWYVCCVTTVCLVDTGSVISTVTEEFVLGKLPCLVIKDIGDLLREI